MEIGFNDRYLMDALKAATGTERIKMKFNIASSPCIIEEDGEKSEFTYMVLPVRMKSGN